MSECMQDGCRAAFAKRPGHHTLAHVDPTTPLLDKLLPSRPRPTGKSYQTMKNAPTGILKQQPVDILCADHSREDGNEVFVRSEDREPRWTKWLEVCPISKRPTMVVEVWNSTETLFNGGALGKPRRKRMRNLGYEQRSHHVSLPEIGSSVQQTRLVILYLRVASPLAERFNVDFGYHPVQLALALGLTGLHANNQPGKQLTPEQVAENRRARRAIRHGLGQISPGSGGWKGTVSHVEKSSWLNQLELSDPPQLQQQLQQLHQQQQEADEDESFHSPPLLRIQPCRIKNGVTLGCFCDTGAQQSVMSYQAAQRCGLLHNLDRRYKGHAVGIGGSCRVVGRLPAGICKLVLGGLEVDMPAITVLEHAPEPEVQDVLLGLDFLREHQAVLDLRKEELQLVIGGRVVRLPFLRPRGQSFGSHEYEQSYSSSENFASSSSDDDEEPLDMSGI
jgi:hypothetical protein